MYCAVHLLLVYGYAKSNLPTLHWCRQGPSPKPHAPRTCPRVERAGHHGPAQWRELPVAGLAGLAGCEGDQAARPQGSKGGLGGGRQLVPWDVEEGQRVPAYTGVWVVSKAQVRGQHSSLHNMNMPGTMLSWVPFRELGPLQSLAGDTTTRHLKIRAGGGLLWSALSA